MPLFPSLHSPLSNLTILLYTDDPGVGGVAQYNHAILLGLRRRGNRAISVQGKANHPLIEQQKAVGVEHEWLDFDTLGEFNRVVCDVDTATEIFSQKQPDLIIFSDACPFSNLGAKQAAQNLGIPYIATIGFVSANLSHHFGENLDPTPYLNALSQAYDAAKTVISVSQNNLNLLCQLYGLKGDIGRVIHYGRPDRYFTPKNQQVRDRLRTELDIPKDAVLCLTVARLEAIKGYQYQLEALRHLRQSPVWENLYFVWIGEGILKAEIEAEIREFGDRVKLLGQRWDVADWHDAADIFILPSELEGMPLAIMEAMAKGNPVIASAVSGIPEELGDTGYLLPNPNENPQGTIDELAKTILTWATHSSLRQTLGKKSQHRAALMFREERMVAETLEIVDLALLPDGDYVSPGLEIIRPDAAFPNMIIGDTQTCPWQYLRREIPHNWYVDCRQPIVGFLSRDEAHILYNTALQFSGKCALEIGCWMGWSACHLALAGVELDVVDPLLERSQFHQSVSQSLEVVGVIDRVNLVPGYSPQRVEELAQQKCRIWSLIFIDGNHESPGPLEDAIACEPYAAADAAILFHDLASPDVAEGLDYFKEKGWHTLIYQTMQIMGIAWRGNVKPIVHQPDPSISWQLPEHLQEYEVSGILPPSGDTSLEELLAAIAHLSFPKILPKIGESYNLLTQLHPQGKTAYVQENWERVLEISTQIVELNPASAIAHSYLSAAYWQQNHIPKSLYHHFLANAAPTWIEDPQSEEFQSLLATVRPYTLLSRERLFSLYAIAKQICIDDIPGNFVECGTYRGGTAAMLASVVQRYSLRPRKVYAFDTFEGMPEPTEFDRHQGIPANNTDWGEGTLKAPIDEYLAVVCKALNVEDLVVAIPGLFANTLPENKAKIGAIALLHADGDWYESTMDIFNNLYDSVVAEGYIQIDDYGHWEGCRQAIHEIDRHRHAAFPLRGIDNTGVWFRKSDPAVPDCNYWRNLYGLAQIAYKQGRISEAQKLVRSVLKLVPDLIPAEELLRAIDPQPQTSQINIKEEYRLREINLIAFPDWNQPEDQLEASLIALLTQILTHPDRDRLCLLIDTSNTDPETADLAISSVLMYLLTETDLDPGDAEPEITLLKPLSADRWQQLLPEISDQIPM
jgi:glycosyltransferase involved in cell wall biosynthesis/tetratricopeptide (TPR) repeat protein